jgi:cell division protease FtsH
MELKRIFRGPLLLVIIAVLLMLFVVNLANSGSSYQPKDTAYVVKLIEQGTGIKSAQITDKNQTIQLTMNNGTVYQANWIGSQGVTLQRTCRSCTTRASWRRATTCRSRTPAPS